MKKVLLLSKICLMAMFLIFSSLPVFAATDSVPKTVNVQGRYTRNYGDPIANTQIRVYFQVKKGSVWESVQGSPFSTTTDSEGLYNLNVTVNNFSSDMTHFRIGIDSEPTDSGYAFASSPYAIYSSTAAYALSLDPANGDKLVDGNFKSDTTYNITVANAVTADNAIYVSTQTASGKSGYVWGIENDVQKWIAPGSISIDKASTSKIGGIKLANNTGLSSDISSDGVLKLLVPTANSLGGVKVGTNIKMGTDGTISVDTADSSKLGLVKLYTNVTDSNTDGSVTQNAIKSALENKQDTLTETQLNAVNSGITSAKVSIYDGYATGKQDKLTETQLNAVNSGITSAKVSTYDGYATGKQDKLTE
ncbi:MAG: hypothetical protein J6U02_00515, partial [Elusimicrobia bacterium]|nr:hypothetical protein [Elusimicrobiota bacterium]